MTDLCFYAKCLRKTKIYLKQRKFSDFTIAELNDYAECIYDLGEIFCLDFSKFSLNRVNKDFIYVPTVTERTKLSSSSWTDLLNTDLVNWERFSSFVEYLFNVRGTEKFEYLVCAGKTKLSNNEKKALNNFAKEFFDSMFYGLWRIFNHHKIVKQKILDYLCEIGVLEMKGGEYYAQSFEVPIGIQIGGIGRRYDSLRANH